MKHFFAAVLFALIISLVSCEGDQDVHYRFTSMDVENVKNTNTFPSPTSDTSIAANQYGIRINLHPEETYRKGRYFDAYESPVTCENAITSILVTADSSFGNNYPAGDSLNDHFILFNGNYLHTTPLLATGGQPTAVDRDDYATHNFPEYTELLLVVPPDTARSFRFRVDIILKDGTHWTDSTAHVFLH